MLPLLSWRQVSSAEEPPCGLLDALMTGSVASTSPEGNAGGDGPGADVWPGVTNWGRCVALSLLHRLLESPVVGGCCVHEFGSYMLCTIQSSIKSMSVCHLSLLHYLQYDVM